MEQLLYCSRSMKVEIIEFKEQRSFCCLTLPLLTLHHKLQWDAYFKLLEIPVITNALVQDNSLLHLLCEMTCHSDCS